MTDQSPDLSGSEARYTTETTNRSLSDPLLAISADILDDSERTRIANENRLRQMLRGGPDDPRMASGKFKTSADLPPDADGEERGFALPLSHPDVFRVNALVGLLQKVENDASLNLQAVMKKHPLGPWVASMKGVGMKQAARLLATIGDPYIRPEILNEDNSVRHKGGPRTVSALWAYAGLHTLPVADKKPDPSGDLDHTGSNAHPHSVWVAARRQKGVQVNWNPETKSRAYLIAESCIKSLCAACKLAGQHGKDCTCSPYRLVYDKRKAETDGRLHAVNCVRCGPSGKPAKAGSVWSDAHRHADALRITSKAILKDLWREAKRIHELS